MNRILFAALCLCFTVSAASAMTFTVTNTNDSGSGSLRQAITDANNAAGADTIDFNIPGPGQKTITITSADLPGISETVTINGGNGGVASNRVEITAGGSFTDGINVGSALNCEIRNLVINGFNRQIGLFGSVGTTIQGCRLCTNPAGNAYVGGIQGIPRDGNETLITSNDNWQDSQQAEIQASGFAPPNTNESAIIAVRPAANTTAIVRGKNNTTGNALVEAYTLSP